MNSSCDLFLKTEYEHVGKLAHCNNSYSRMSRFIPFNYQYPADFIGARMKFKPSKSRSISIVKGKLGEQRFFIDQGPIPTATEKQIKRVRLYDSKLKDSDQAELTKGLEVNDKSMLPGKLKIWCCLALCGH